MTNFPSGVNFSSWSSATGLGSGRPFGGQLFPPSETDEYFVIAVHAVLALGPFEATASAAPGLDEVAGGVEDHHRWRRHGRLIGLERPRTVQQPDVVLCVDRKA